MSEAGPAGNFIAEWFGYRVWPDVDDSERARTDQPARICPFLSSATRERTGCIKTARGYDEPTGLCTVSSDSNGVREDWLACPFRILDQHFTLLGGAVRTLYRIPSTQRIVLFPVTVLGNSERQREIREALASGVRVFVFSGDKLGGEVDVPETDDSPGSKVDNSVIEITGLDPSDGKPNQFGEHAFFEIQTADFHGSPLDAVRLLREKCPKATTEEYHERFRARPEDCGEDMEGPNKSNIFKRTIYQMILKIELAESADSAGFVIVLPVSVWQSWLKHLGQPTLIPTPTDASISHLRSRAIVTSGTEEAGDDGSPRAWIFVFDIERDSTESPRPIKIVHRIATTADALIEHAFHEAPRRAIAKDATKTFRKVLINNRVLKGWKGQRLPEEPRPEFEPPEGQGESPIATP